jgi:TonB-linked SusC/RagA family outer membrane protein
MRVNLPRSAAMKTAMTLFFIAFAQVVWSQQIVSGKVTAEDGLALPGVNVLIEHTANGTTTDSEGKYSLSVGSADAILVFSFIGYKTSRVPVGNQTTINQMLEQDLQSLEEVIVVGYGTQKKRDVTGAIASVNADKIAERQPTNVFDALQGQVAGVMINTESRPGAGASIRIRGTATIQGGENPLYVVDGVPVENINGINPADIQSMEILKDAASSAIYGSRSANGVILITTKRGEIGKPRIDLQYNTMLSTLAHKLPQATANDRRLYDKKRTGDDQTLNTDSLNPSYNSDNDLQDMLTRTAIRQQVDLSVSGANEKLSYYTSLGYLNDEGIIINSWSKMARARINVDYKATDKLTYGNRMQFSYQLENRINEGNTLKQAMQRPPTFRVYFPDGTFAPNLGGRKNPVAEALLAKNEYKTYGGSFYNYLSYQIADGLKFTTDFNIRVEVEDRLFFSPKLLSNDGKQNSGGYSTAKDLYWMQQNYLNFDKTFGDHTINAVAGISAEKWIDQNMQIEGNNYVTEAILTSNAIQDKILTEIYNNESRHTMVGMFGRLGYSYKGRYIVNTTLRRDGSSRFGKDNRWGLFPSVALGWRFTDEQFMSWATRFLDDGKFRVSYGATGNERIGNYDALELYTFGENFYNGVLGIIPSEDDNKYRMGNSALSWETTKQFDAGIDLTFVNNRVTFTADYYRKVTSDLLYDAPLPGELGYTSVRVNVGSIQNEGFEFMINTYPVRNSKVTWNLSYNMSFNNDKVLELYGGVPITSNSRWFLEEGGRLGNFYGWKNLGVYQYDESNAYTPTWERLTPVFDEGGTFTGYTFNGQAYTGEVKKLRMPGGTSQGGDVIWYNANGSDDMIDDKDRVILANAQPKFIAGLYNQVSYKGFSLAFNIYVQWGNTIYNKGRRDQSTFNGTNLTPDKYIIRDAWFQPGDVTDVPRVPDASTMGNMPELNSYFLEDGSFIRLRNVKLSYSLDKALVSKVKLKGASVYVYGNNLVTWTNYLWFDPEIPLGNPLTMGEDNGKYPRSRQIGVGVNLNF